MQGDSDNGFVGMDMRVSPHVLPAAYYAYAENVRTRNGYVETRRGTWLPPWANRIVEGKIAPMGAAHGGCVFKDPGTGYPWLIVAAGGKVYAGHHARAPFEVIIPSDLDLTGRVRFVQCFDGLLMFREGKKQPLVMRDLDSGFGYVDQVELETDEEDQPIEQHLPPGEFAVKAANRIFVPHAGDLVFASGVNEFAKGPVTLQPFRVNQGSDDEITAIYKYGRTSLIVGKERSVYVVRNVYGDLSDIVLDEFSSEYGIAGPDCVVEVGSDLWFLATRRGIVSIRQTEQNEIQGNSEPISKPITPIINKIDWRRAKYSLAATHDSYVYFVVPVHDCGAQTWAMLVYDAQVGAWVSVDWGPWLENPVAFLPLVYQSEQRLGILNSNGYVVLLDDGLADDYMEGSNQLCRQINATLRTRGYLGAMPGYKDFKRVDWLCETWDPHYDVLGVMGGATETCIIRRDMTKDRTRVLRPWNAADYSLDNRNDDHYRAYREDYSLSFAGGVKMCFGNNGIRPEQFQEFNEGGSINRAGPYFQVEFRTHRGALKIKKVSIGAHFADAALQSKV